MTIRRGLYRTWIAVVGGAVIAAAAPAAAGPWSALPDAVARLQARPNDPTALATLRQVEQSLLTEAGAGRLLAMATLMEAYENLVTPLADGDRRCEDLRQRASRALVSFGDGRLAGSRAEAGRAWALAATYWPDDDVLDRLRSLLAPPDVAEAGATWRSEQDGAELVFHPAAQFDMGCTWNDTDCAADEAGRRVRTNDFWIEGREVTNRRYRLCVEAGACAAPRESEAYRDPARADEPVTGVTWYQARRYAAWTGRRLPSEAEWERAARGELEGARFPWGRGRDRDAANLYLKEGEDRFDGVAAVALFPATGLGIYDIGGNVWEWCADAYRRDITTGPRDGRPLDSGGWGRVLRGGSWRRTIELARVSSRWWQEESYAADDVGFRCAVDASARITANQLVDLAHQIFPMAARPGTELAGSELTSADRRYLERMALTWEVIEGRIEEALPRAAAMLRRDPGDPVASDLLDQLEAEMERQVQRGDIASVRAALDGYRRAAADDRRLERRLASHEQRLMNALQLTVEGFVSRGEYGRASASIRFAQALRPGDPVLVTLTAWIEPAPGAVREWPHDGKQMVWIPGGRFRMGASPNDGGAAYNEHPAHGVEVGPFWLDRTEVTNDEYRRCVEAEACTPPNRSATFDDPNFADHPVVSVTWFQAASYARWVGRRLPTEAEWEWAARGGQATRYPWGDDWENGKANALGVGGADRWGGTAPVSSFPPGAWGLHDMVGNAAEWVQDIYHRNFWEAPTDGRAWLQLTGPPVEDRRVIRGGSYSSQPNRLRISHRDDRPPIGSNRTVGFRCAAD